MLLAIDVGNTNTVLGYFQDKKLIHTWRVSTHPLCTTDEFKMKLDMILQSLGTGQHPIEKIVVSSVVPAFTRMLQAAYPGPELAVIHHQWPFSFEVRANPPQQVGADRLVNAEAVVQEYGYPAIVVDSGTATTICAIGKSAEGKPLYLGGAIIPGIEMAMEALANKTALLFTVDLTPPNDAIGHNTKEALKSGLVFGYASMIDGMIDRFKVELGSRDLPVVATGGISHLMKGIARELTHFDGDLTLKGIAHLYESFRKQ